MKEYKKEYKIGEKFELDGVEYVCKQDDVNSPCVGCMLSDYCDEFACCMGEREDGDGVHFEKVNP